MKKIITTGVLAMALAAAAPLPSAAQNREHLQMAAELRILQEQQAQLALAVSQLAQALNEAVKTLNTRSDQTNAAISKGFADQGLTLRTLSDDLRALRANSQDTSVRLGELKEEIEALRASVTSMLTRSTSIAPTLDPLDPLDPAAAAGAAPPPLPSTIGLSPEQLFQTALGDYAGGQFSLAVSGFEYFIRNFPTSNRVDDAYIYIGDAEYSQGRWEEAVAAYNQGIERKDDQLPHAYYKRGLALERLDRFDDARASFELAVKTAPGTESNVAVQAKQSLERLSRRTPAR